MRVQHLHMPKFTSNGNKDEGRAWTAGSSRRRQKDQQAQSTVQVEQAVFKLPVRVRGRMEQVRYAGTITGTHRYRYCSVSMDFMGRHPVLVIH